MSRAAAKIEKSQTPTESAYHRTLSTSSQGRNKPTSRAMEWCGWATSSREKSSAECGCTRAECKGGKSKDVKLESVQTEVFNQMRKAQATWITLGCRTLTKVSTPIPGQRHPPKPLRSIQDLWDKARREPSSSSTGVQLTQANEPLSAAERSLLLEQDDPITFVEGALRVIHEANEDAKVRQLGIIENPMNSWLCDFDFMKTSQWSVDTADDERWTDADHVSCLWGGVRAKKQRSKTNMHAAREALHMEGMAGVQCHDHPLQEREPWNASLSELTMPGQAEDGYPARFVWQMAVAISYETARKLQFHLSVPRSPALQLLIGEDRLWWTTLTADTVSGTMMVPIGLQLMLCPARDKGHIPPVICAPFLQQLPEGAACCDTRATEKFQTEAKFLTPFEGDSPAAGNEEVAAMRYMDAWLRTTSTERLECVSSLASRMLVTDSMLGNTSYVYFLAAMVADYIRKNLSIASADMAQIPCEALAPRAQEVVDTATKSEKHRWLHHIKRADRKGSRPSAKLAARPEPKTKSQPKAKPKPEVKRRPGAPISLLLTSAATTAASLPLKVPLMHKH